MVRRLAVRETRFHNPRLRGVGVEVLTLAELRERAGNELFVPERLEFLLVLMVESGSGVHLVDFCELALRAGSVVCVRPGQVQQWIAGSRLQGTLVLVAPEALAPAMGRAQNAVELLALDEWPQHARPDASVVTEARWDIRRLHTDLGRFSGTVLEAAIIRHALYAMLLRLSRDLRARGSPAKRTRESEIRRHYSRRLETELHRRLSVQEHAHAMGCSESTLSRACLAVTGKTAKALLDQRISLEAKRLLAHSPASVSQIGYQLGFSEPTNFVKFFRRLEHMTPEAFRRQLRG